jgi:hypothetical protein
VVGWSCGFPRRLGEFYTLRHLADGWIFNNRECWIGSGQLPRTTALANGVDRDIFSMTRPPATRRPKVSVGGVGAPPAPERLRRPHGPLQARLRARASMRAAAGRFARPGTSARSGRWPRGTTTDRAGMRQRIGGHAESGARGGRVRLHGRLDARRQYARAHSGRRERVSRRPQPGRPCTGVERALDAYPRWPRRCNATSWRGHWADRSQGHFAFFRDVLARGPRHPPRGPTCRARSPYS